MKILKYSDVADGGLPDLPQRRLKLHGFKLAEGAKFSVGVRMDRVEGSDFVIAVRCIGWSSEITEVIDKEFREYLPLAVIPASVMVPVRAIAESVFENFEMAVALVIAPRVKMEVWKRDAVEGLGFDVEISVEIGNVPPVPYFAQTRFAFTKKMRSVLIPVD